MQKKVNMEILQVESENDAKIRSLINDVIVKNLRDLANEVFASSPIQYLSNTYKKYFDSKDDK